MPLTGQTVVVLGMGRSGQSAAILARDLGATVICADQNPASTAPDGCTNTCGESHLLALKKADTLVVSPGVPASLSPIKDAAEKGTRVVGELAFAAQLIRDHAPIPVAAITGTNGKSSTTHLTGQMLSHNGFRPWVGGNLGQPLSDLAHQRVVQPLRNQPVHDVAVIEVSSYQMELPERFHADAACVLNITPDHLARHGDMQNYAATKLRIFDGMGPGDLGIMPLDEPWLNTTIAGLTKRGGAIQWIGKNPGVDWSSHPPNLVEAEFQGTRDDGTVDLSAFPLPGTHNVSNALAAALLAIHLGAKRDEIRMDALEPLPHRMEIVCQSQGIRWINDSKATNIDAALVGIEGAGTSSIVLLGGEGKAGADYRQLITALEQRAKAVICFGASGTTIATSLTNSGLQPLVHNPTNFIEAMRLAAQLASRGDTVLLSPACASFDEFSNFERRGEAFGRVATELMDSNEHRGAS